MVATDSGGGVNIANNPKQKGRLGDRAEEKILRFYTGQIKRPEF